MRYNLVLLFVHVQVLLRRVALRIRREPLWCVFLLIEALRGRFAAYMGSTFELIQTAFLDVP